uniref:Uncharacterized protein p12-3 n=1 Tax=Hyposoter didymator TaxID=260305 RepID=D7P5N8_HYPDD|nr:unknown [Hyposoter didymator]
MSGFLSVTPNLISAGISMYNYYHVQELAGITVNNKMTNPDLEKYKQEMETVQWASLAAAVTTSINGVLSIFNAGRHHHHHPGHIPPPPYTEHYLGDGHVH